MIKDILSDRIADEVRQAFSSDPSPQSDPEIGLLARYEQMIQKQLDTINDIDDKAAFVARLEGLLIGISISAASVVLGPDQIRFSFETLFVLLTFGAAMGSFFISIIFALITYQKSKLLYGPTYKLGEYMSKYRVDGQEYRDNLLAGYSHAIRKNWEVMVSNANQFEKSLASLLAGIIFLFTSGVLLILSAPFIVDTAVGLGALVIAAWLAGKINREDFITLDGDPPRYE